jgi:hypothetical protein
MSSNITTLYHGTSREQAYLYRQESDIVSEAFVQLCVDSLTADVADMLAKEKSLDVTAALQKFMTSKTYELLFDEHSLLYLESAGYIYEMLCDEYAGNWNRWREE